ncbi:MAG: flagellar hook-associated protein FlgK [Myxococcaceae bacterium]|nr:flagellar hook-associated protein FlgK [Myxococcaceae bacterium]
MGDLFSLLSLGANALSAHRAASSTASHNLANANTPGYSRQRANLEAVLPAYRLGGSFFGRGVSLNSVSQARDFGAERQFALANEARARNEAQAGALESLAALDPQASGAIGSQLADFYASMRALQQNPGDLSLRQSAIGQSRALALAFNRTAAGIAGARDSIDTRLSSQVSEVNELATQMANLNQQIRVARGSGAEPNDLLDARQAVQDRLGQLVGATAIPTAEGDVNLALPGGTTIVNGELAGQLSTVPDATNGGHLGVRLTRPDGTGQVSVSTFGGEWGGMLSARDGALKAAETALDTLAFDWAGSVNTVHRSGFALDGSTGRDLFDAGAQGGAAGRITVNAALLANPSLLAASSSATTLPGDGNNLQLLIGTETAALSNGLNALQGFAGIVASYGAAAGQARAAADADAAIFDYATGLRESVSGVSIDEEIVELTKAQRGFEAVMKVIQTTDEMLNTLMQLKA